ncbi:Cortexillin [Entamoeba marina]
MQVTDTILNKSINRTKVVEEQQLFAYKNYLNFVLSEEPYVIDITKDLQDGSILNRFLLNLCGKLVPQTKEKPTKDIEKIQNLSNIVQFLKDEGIKIYGSAEEIFNGDQKTILSLLYQLLYRYRLGECPVKMSDFSKWIRSVLKVDNINKFDLKQELSKGVVFAKMLNYIENDVVNIEQLNGNGLEIITLCIDTAYEKFNIPKLIIPKYVENQEIDDFCLYLYLTFFILKETDFEDNEILRDIVAGIRERKIQMRQSFRSRLSTTLYRLLENIENDDYGWYFDSSYDPIMKELRDWQSKVNGLEKEITTIITTINRKKRKTMNGNALKSLLEDGKKTSLTIRPQKTLDSSFKELQEKYQLLEKQVKEMTLELESKNKIIKDLKQQNNELVQKSNKYDLEKKDKETEIEKEIEKRKHFEGVVIKQEKQIEEIQKEMKISKDQIHEKTKEKEEKDYKLKQHIQELNNENSLLKEQLDKKDIENKTYQQQIQSIEERKKVEQNNLTKTILELENKIQESENIFIEKSKQITELEMKIQDFEMNLIENDDDKKVFFNSLALAIKIAIPKKIVTDNTSLYIECKKERVPMKNWNHWLVNKLTSL